MEALYCLHRSLDITPIDPQTVYGLAFAYTVLGDIEQAKER